MFPVGHLVFKTSETQAMRLVGSTPTSSAIQPFTAFKCDCVKVTDS